MNHIIEPLEPRIIATAQTAPLPLLYSNKKKIPSYLRMYLCANMKQFVEVIV